MEKDLSIICVGYQGKDGVFKYEYKHQVKWTRLECTENNYITDIPMTICNNNFEIENKYYLEKSTKELIYDELQSALISIFYHRKDKSELSYEDKIKLRELKHLKNLYVKYTDKKNLVMNIYLKQTSQKMIELNVSNYVNDGFDKNTVIDTYDYILSNIIVQINRINNKAKKISESAIKKKCLKNVSSLLKRDYAKQQNYFTQKENELKNDIKDYQNNLKDTSQLNYELQKIQRLKKQKNLRNFREKAKNLLQDNGLNVDAEHK